MTAPPVAVEPATLQPGGRAPEFRVEQFLKGEPFSTLQKGQIYVLDFWATWCGPCIMSMPHLSELQREYKAKGVTICAINIWENPEYTAATQAPVARFVKNREPQLDFTIAYDGAAKYMDNAWMRAAGKNGIPCTFVVDRQGVVVWIGHPDSLDMVLEEVTSGRWEIVSGPERLQAAAAEFTKAAAQYHESLAAGTTAWEAAMKRYPALGRTRGAQQLKTIFNSGHVTAACELGERIVADATRTRNPSPITSVLEVLSDPQTLKTAPARTLLLKASQANFELADPTESGPHVVLARALFFAHRSAEARVEAKKALDLAPASTRASIEKWLKQIEQAADHG